MTTQEKRDLGFDIKKIPETKPRKAELKNPYAKRYMANKTNVVVSDEVTNKMREIKNKRNIKSDSDTIKYLCDLEIAVDPKFETAFKCNGCSEEIKNIPENININRFVHNDLCITTPCKGHIVKSSNFKLNDKGFVISNKDKANGTTTKSDKNNEQIDTNEQDDEDNDEEIETKDNDYETSKTHPISDNNLSKMDLRTIQELKRVGVLK